MIFCVATASANESPQLASEHALAEDVRSVATLSGFCVPEMLYDYSELPEEHQQVNIVGIIIVGVNVLLVIGAMFLLYNAKRLRKKQTLENENI